MGDREGCTPTPDSDNSGEVDGMKTSQSSEEKSEEVVKEMEQWVALPADLVQCIADRLLVNVIDYIRFRVVCKPWRSATTDPRDLRKPPQLPWLMLSFNKISNDRCFFRLSDRTSITLDLPEVINHRILGCTDGWLVLIHESSAIRLFDPLTRAQIHLPSLTTLPQVIGYDVQNVGEEYVVQFEEGEDVASVETMRDIFVRKLVISSKHHSGGVIVMASIDYLERVVFARPGDDKWSVVHQTLRCDDILCYQGNFYVINNRGVLAVFDIGPPAKLTRIAVPVDYDVGLFGPSSYLVESKGDLLVVDRCWDSDAYHSVYKTRYFRVFKVENPREDARLIEVKSLGDEMLFLGASESMSVSSEDYPGWRGNCIYFTTGYVEIYSCGHFGDDFGVFSLEDGVIESLPCYPDNSHFVWPPPVWFAPNVSRDHDLQKDCYIKFRKHDYSACFVTFCCWVVVGLLGWFVG